MEHFSRRQVTIGGFALALNASLSRSALADASPLLLTFVLTNDLYKISEENGRGGMARLVQIVKKERASGHTTLLTHAGDALSPSLLSGFDQGASMMDLLNQLHPDFFVPGNHEFDFGKDIFLKRMRESRFPLLAANLRMPDGAMVPGFIDQSLMDIQGLKIGLSGATLDETPRLSSPEDMTFLDTVTTLSERAKDLRRAGADLTIAIVHADKPTIQRLAATHAYDLIISGHNHDLALDYDGRVVTAESGEDAHQILCIDLTLSLKQNAGKRVFSWWPNFRIVDSATLEPDADMLSRVKAYEAQLSTELDRQIAVLDVPLDTRETAVRTGETAFGNVLADALRATTGANIALVNGGGIRGDRLYEAGTRITRRDIFTELPFGNRTILAQVSGQNLRLALENGFSALGKTAGRFPQVSGMVIKAKQSLPVGARVQSVTIEGLPLEDSRLYTLATLDYLAKGGDGYTSLAKANASPDMGDHLMVSDLINYLEKTGHIDAKIEGRILIEP